MLISQGNVNWSVNQSLQKPICWHGSFLYWLAVCKASANSLQRYNFPFSYSLGFVLCCSLPSFRVSWELRKQTIGRLEVWRESQHCKSYFFGRSHAQIWTAIKDLEYSAASSMLYFPWWHLFERHLVFLITAPQILSFCLSWAMGMTWKS